MRPRLLPDIYSGARRFWTFPRRILGLLVLSGFLLVVAVPFREPGEPLTVSSVLVWSHRQRKIRRRRLKWLGPRHLCFAIRVCRDGTVLSMLAVMNLVADCGQCSAVIAVVLMLLRESLHAVGMARGDVRWLKILVPVERAFRVAVVAGLWFAAGHLVCPAGSELAGLAGGSMSGRSEATVRVEGNHVVISTTGPAVLAFDIHCEDDERLVMVLCRLLCSPEGKHLLTHQVVADAFGKNDRRDCHNHFQQFRREGNSLAKMVIHGQRGRPRHFHLEVEMLLASFWERNPLVTWEETYEWLSGQPLPAGVRLPSEERLKKMTTLRGNLLTMRSAIQRLLRRAAGGAMVHPEYRFRRLLEVVDEQARLLKDAGIQGPSVPAILADNREPVQDDVRSRTGRALLQAVKTLFAVPAPEDDEALAASVGTSNMADLHYAVLYCMLQLSISQVAGLVDKSKSVVYRGLVRFAGVVEQLDPFPAHARFSGVLALDEKWVKIPKSFAKEQRDQGKKWRYVFFAVDAITGDILHIDVFDSSKADNIRVFLAAVRAKGIRPRAVVTDMLASYENIIRETFGERVVHHYCLFHHLQAVRHRLRDKCGNNWKSKPLLRELVQKVDRIYKCKDRRTAKRRLARVVAMRDKLARRHPEALSVLGIIQERFPMVANALGRDDISATNNLTERTIKAFNRHYRGMAGFEAIETARIQARLFRFFYRLTPMPEAVRPEDRGKCPLERAGWNLAGIPIADYVTGFARGWDRDGPDWLALQRQPATRPTEPSEPLQPVAVVA